MAEGKSRSNQKLKIMYLYQILLENTDATHSITTQQIIDKLAFCDVTAERKSIYDDIEQLRKFGINIEKVQANKTYSYRIVNRQFSLPELKLMVDSVQAAKFITEEKSNELIKKIESCASNYEASKLQRQVYVNGRVKSMNEAILKNVDIIHQAIAENSRVRFKYFQWNVKKKMVPRHDGELYEVSPWGLSLSDENYYLIAYDSRSGIIKHYRVDKMLEIELSDNKREGKDIYAQTNLGEYAKKHFGMFDGAEKRVSILCHNRLAGVMIDRFGQDVTLIKRDEEHFEAKVKVAVSNHFIGWVFALGEDAKIIGPESVLEKVNEEIERIIKQYR